MKRLSGNGENDAGTGLFREPAAALIGLMLLAAGCAYRGGDDPISRKFTWFSYLNGDDIRAACKTDGTPRYRFVYNGVYVQQVRTYDITPDPATGGHRLKVRVIGPTRVDSVTIEDPVKTLSTDPLAILAPGAGEIQEVSLIRRDLDDLDRALARSGFFRPAPSFLRLTSEDFYWIGTACLGGRLAFNAYRWPSPEFTNAAFPDVLLTLDPTGIPVNPPRDLSNLDIYGDNQANEQPRFSVTVDRDHLVGVGTLF
jgi:hypothetical protein